RKLTEHRHAPLPTRSPSRRVLLRLLAGLRGAVLRRFGLGGVGYTGSDLLFETDDLLILRLERQRLLPLIFRLEFASDTPIGIAQMIVDDGIVGVELARALEVLNGRWKIPQPEIGPAQAIDIVAVVGFELHRLAAVVHSLLHIAALINPEIAEIIQHEGLVGRKL